jgi:hypothetical protein
MEQDVAKLQMQSQNTNFGLNVVVFFTFLARALHDPIDLHDVG